MMVSGMRLLAVALLSLIFSVSSMKLTLYADETCNRMDSRMTPSIVTVKDLDVSGVEIQNSTYVTNSTVYIFDIACYTTKVNVSLMDTVSGGGYFLAIEGMRKTCAPAFGMVYRKFLPIPTSSYMTVDCGVQQLNSALQSRISLITITLGVVAMTILLL